MKQKLNKMGRKLTQIFANKTKGPELLLVSKKSGFFMSGVNLRGSAAKAVAKKGVTV